MQRGKIYLSNAEETILESLVKMYVITELEALEYLVKQKRELAFYHSLRGNVELANLLLREIGEK